MTTSGVSLNKFIADSGLCSRRDADALITARRVKVNGAVAGLGAVVGDGSLKRLVTTTGPTVVWPADVPSFAPDATSGSGAVAFAATRAPTSA